MEINRAVALAALHGPVEGLVVLDALSSDVRLVDYQPYWAARAGLLARAGEVDAAERAYEHAIGLESDLAVRRFLLQKRSELRRAGTLRDLPGLHGDEAVTGGGQTSANGGQAPVK